MPDYSAAYERLEEPQKRGQATEALLKAAFVVRDVPVLVPEYDNEPYDFVVQIEDDWYRIQAKTAYAGQNSGTVRFETRSTRVTAEGYERDEYDGDIDHFAVYNPHYDEIYLIACDDVPTDCMTIRCRPSERGSPDRVNWHEEFRLDKVLQNIRAS